MSQAGRFEREQQFHDQWAKSAQENLPDPVLVNEAITSPELRHIHACLGDVRGLKILDVGCGLGEASVYFALRGAQVTASDLSGEMLQATQLLAQKHGTKVHTKKTAAESLGFSAEEKFDVIYVGNLFHHVDIAATLDVILPHLAGDGRLVSWDPLAYNPLINVYRMIATGVRTPDEHPLKRADVRLIRSRLRESRADFFWLTNLVIFILMALRSNPNKVRFWKAVVDEGESWRWLFVPLAAVDRMLLTVCPPLKWLCWNVVIIGRGRA